MEVKDYFPNGKLEFTKYITKEGEVHEKYFPNGQKKYRHVYRDGKPYGQQKGWYSNGKVKYVGHYNAEGKEDGLYRKYDSSGKIQEKIRYSEGMHPGPYAQEESPISQLERSLRR